MKLVKALPVILVLVAVITVLPGCNSDSNVETAGTQTAAVTRGNLIVDISAAGNLALAETQDLAFEVAGTVLEIKVDVGDTVKKGQELAKLDTTEWEKTIKSYENAIITAQHTLDLKEIALLNAQRNVTVQERLVIGKEMAVQEAELNVDVARNTLNDLEKVEEAQDKVDAAEMDLEVIKALSTGAYGGGVQSLDIGYWALLKNDAEENLEAAQEDLQDVLDTTDVTLTNDVIFQIKQAQFNITKKQLAVQDAQFAVDDANYAVAQANIAVKNAQYEVDIAKSALEDAKADLDEAKNLNPVIIAPFDGFVPSINVEGGDEVLKGTVAMQIADPDKFEADILVSEMDIPKVKIGSQATVTADALPGTILFATVTHIAPTATISSGVVNYSVRVEVQSPGSSPFGQLGGISGTGDNSSAPSFPKGGFTQPEDTEASGEFKFPAFSGNQSFGQFFPAADTSIQLREGLTVTVNIVVDSRMNVLIVPNGAIVTEGVQSYVQVVKDTGEQEKRAVTLGISNWIFTEITDGLEEGEEIEVMLNLAPDFDFGGGMMFFGGGR